MDIRALMGRAVASIAPGIIACAASGGPLGPPAGPVAPTPGPEPRIAINSTNTPGDADSLYRITAPGSYYLTGNVTGVAAKCGIEIASSGVSVDLMGFELRGVAGSLDGIKMTTTDAVNIAIRNGLIREWGEHGIEIGSGSTSAAIVESIQASDNAIHGILAETTALVRGCAVVGNNSDGINTAAGSTVVDCIARENTDDGFDLANANTITSCSAYLNSGDGINVGTASVVQDCVAYGNQVTGIRGGSGVSVARCATYTNDGVGIDVSSGAIVSACSVYSNVAHGISCESDCLILGNVCDGNGVGTSFGAGILASSSENRIDGNNCTDNDVGVQVDAGGNIIVRNTSAGNTTDNWDIAAGNVALIVSAIVNIGAIQGDSGGASPGSANPFANFTY